MDGQCNRSKIAGKGSLTTHVNSGGDTKLLQELFPDSTKQIQIENKLKHTALQISYALDEQVTGNIGEIGFDIGLDTQENPWLFEANSKPGRTVFQDAKLKEQSELTRQLFYEYAIYLTEHSLRDTKKNVSNKIRDFLKQRAYSVSYDSLTNKNKTSTSFIRWKFSIYTSFTTNSVSTLHTPQ